MQSTIKHLAIVKCGISKTFSFAVSWKGGRSEAKTTAVDHLNDVALGAPPKRVPLSTHLSESYGDDMDILYIAASGQSDATRASIPWHLAVNGSFEAGQSTGILLLGDAAEVLVPQVRDAIEGLGIAPLRDLLSKARDTSLPVFV